jgi:hypothetical protein
MPLPIIAMIAGGLITFGSLSYAIGRTAYLYLAGFPGAVIEREAGLLTVICLLVVPFSALLLIGGWIWHRGDKRLEAERTIIRKGRRRPEKPGRRRL